MTPQTTSKRVSFRGSPLARRVGSILLGIITATYLTMITFTMSGQLHTTRAAVRLALLWLMGVVALGLLARAWRRPPSGMQ